jgi:hypothetical protein
MTAPSSTRVAAALPADCRSRLMEQAREVNFAEGTRFFREGGHADRFWIVRSGTVTLDVHVPGDAQPSSRTLAPASWSAARGSSSRIRGDSAPRP